MELIRIGNFPILRTLGQKRPKAVPKIRRISGLKRGNAVLYSLDLGPPQAGSLSCPEISRPLGLDFVLIMPPEARKTSRKSRIYSKVV
ncbi:hypothetical protein K474DRAFT_1666457 [Panus rudis PR-1116 ss-1]|nr:hypothetical protein K474DRAFT_1666457 [Panus rudis PR-1116 ss-1]